MSLKPRVSMSLTKDAIGKLGASDFALDMALALKMSKVSETDAVRIASKWISDGSRLDDAPIYDPKILKPLKVNAALISEDFLTLRGMRAPPRPIPMDEPPRKASPPPVHEEEEEKIDPEPLQGFPTSSSRVFTETASRASEETAGTGNPLARTELRETPRVTVRDVRTAAHDSREEARDEDEENSAEWTKLAIEFLNGLSYMGFSTVRTRAAFYEHGGFKELVQLLSIYVRVGNASKKRLRKGTVRDDEVADKATKLLKDMDIAVKGRGTEKMTLPRLAQSFAPVLFALRLSTESLLEVRVITTSPVVFQDVALGGLYNEATDFHEKFGRILSSVDDSSKGMSESEVDRKNAGFRELARQNLRTDVSLLDGVKSVVDLSSAFQWFQHDQRVSRLVFETY